MILIESISDFGYIIANEKIITAELFTGTATAIVAGVGALAKGIGAVVKKKRAKEMGASIRSPQQTAMVAQLARRNLALERGMDDSNRNSRLSKTASLMHRRSILAGSRDTSQIRDLISKNEEAVIRGKSQERLGVLSKLVDETRNQADRTMDLAEQAKAQESLDASSSGNVASKNIQGAMASPSVSSAIEGVISKRKNKKMAGDAEEAKKKGQKVEENKAKSKDLNASAEAQGKDASNSVVSALGKGIGKATSSGAGVGSFIGKLFK